MPKPPPSSEQERARIEGAIRDAFKGVSRDGGISWSEADAIDSYASTEERARMRAKDTDREWTQLVDDPSWNPDAWGGGFNFLDPIGVRYYLAPAMIRFLRSERDGDGSMSLGFFLVLKHEDHEYPSYLNKKALRRVREHHARQLSLLTPAQRAAIALFLRHMNEFGWKHEDCKAYESGWAQWDPQRPPVEPP